jgi:hypothetical protein
MLKLYVALFLIASSTIFNKALAVNYTLNPDNNSEQVILSENVPDPAPNPDPVPIADPAPIPDPAPIIDPAPIDDPAPIIDPAPIADPVPNL